MLAGARDPDAGQTLQYEWFHYAEAGVADGNLAERYVERTRIRRRL